MKADDCQSKMDGAGEQIVGGGRGHLVLSSMVVPETDLARIRRFCEKEVPIELRDQVRVEHRLRSRISRSSGLLVPCDEDPTGIFRHISHIRGKFPARSPRSSKRNSCRLVLWYLRFNSTPRDKEFRCHGYRYCADQGGRRH